MIIRQWAADLKFWLFSTCKSNNVLRGKWRQSTEAPLSWSKFCLLTVIKRTRWSGRMQYRFIHTHTPHTHTFPLFSQHIFLWKSKPKQTPCHFFLCRFKAILQHIGSCSKKKKTTPEHKNFPCNFCSVCSSKLQAHNTYNDRRTLGEFGRRHH